MDIPFEKGEQIRQISATDQVCEKIKQSIRSGTWRIGTRLPSESALAAHFGVNRLTIRMALQKLNTLGVLETRNGSGTYVIQFDFDDLIKEAADFYMEPELLENISEFRKVVEIECARLAILRGTPEEFDRLEVLLDEYTEISKTVTGSSSDDYSLIAKADLDFHRQICEMAHNKLYLYSFIVAQNPIYQHVLTLAKQRWAHWHNEHRQDEPFSADIHKDIFLSMKQGDFEKCREYYMRMVDNNFVL